MKTSNKLLIAFGLTLILLPILTMTILSRTNMVEGNETQTHMNTSESFENPSRGMTAISISKPFNAVYVYGDNELAISIKVINDPKYGVKIPDDAKSLITAELNEHGQLQIKLKKKPAGDESYFRRIIIYGPAINQMNIENAKVVNLTAKLDSLKLNIINGQSAWIDADALIKNLIATTHNVGGFGMEESNVVSAKINIKNTHFTSRHSNMDYLNITTDGNSEIEIDGAVGDQPEKIIKNLVMTTLGKTKVKISDVKINDCSGTFSDSTKVDMPAININQMFKIKK